MTIGKALKRNRISRGLSQTEVGNILGGITFQQIQKYERGINRLSADYLLTLLGAWSITLEEFVGEEATIEKAFPRPDLASVKQWLLIPPKNRVLMLKLYRTILEIKDLEVA